MKMKNYTHYKRVYITSYPYVLLIPFLHFSDQKALGREYNCKISDPRGVGENCTQTVMKCSTENSLKSIHLQPLFYPLSCKGYFFIGSPNPWNLDKIPYDRFSSLVIIKITQTAFYKHRFSSFTFVCSNSVSLTWA